MECYITLKNATQGGDEYLNSTAMHMWPKFQKYWSQFSSILGIALVFDPRYKMQFIDLCYNKAFRHNSEELFSLREKLESLFDEYALKLDHSTSPSTSKKKDKSKAPHRIEVHESDLLKEFDNVSSDLFYASNQKSQLKLYLDEPRMKRGNCIWMSLE
ncbi:zinc finger BED domain-containing protein RICESLEEPER 2-like [Morus notabilis]|uniref:zinc finger BED domain-containing protein RICESLEEPER 2-like n=1 Tax=Morus notabilis TaxID=981085 RepID=UPI000CECFF21|nr:zinc finger BED domain-containing protein RICESLEEPER 2-like [Morus notabilis]